MDYFFPLEMLMHIYICHGNWAILNFTYSPFFSLFLNVWKYNEPVGSQMLQFYNEGLLKMIPAV